MRNECISNGIINETEVIAEVAQRRINTFAPLFTKIPRTPLSINYCIVALILYILLFPHNFLGFIVITTLILIHLVNFESIEKNAKISFS